MKRKEVIAILKEDVSMDDYKRDKNGFLLGLNLLAEINPSFDTDDFCADHDIIYTGDFEETIKHITPEQVRQMNAWGFHYDSNCEGFAYFT
jgi:hypothetical protein